MYEVEFAFDPERLQRAFRMARFSTDDIDFGAVVGRVLNAQGEAPASSLGVSPSYDAGARGPTNRTNVFTPIRITCTFNGHIVKGNDDASRHYLTDNDVRFFERAAKVYARRPDLAPNLTLGMKIRRLLEENEPSDDNATDASLLYSALVDYPAVIIFEAGGTNSAYSISLDALRRPIETQIDNYGEGDQG